MTKEQILLLVSGMLIGLVLSVTAILKLGGRPVITICPHCQKEYEL